MAIPARLNKLSAVNIMLSMCGQAPVSTVEGAVPSIVAIAKNILDEETRNVLSEGFSFNTYKDVVFYPDTSDDDKIAVPDDLLGADHRLLTRNITMDGGYFYDDDNASFAFDDPLTLDVVRMKDFDTLPESAKTWIARKAGRILQRRHIGNLDIDRSLAQDEADALIKFKQWESDRIDPNIRQTEVGFTIRAVRRGIWGY